MWDLVAEALDRLYYCFAQFFSQRRNIYVKFRIFFKDLIIAPYLFYDFSPGNASSLRFQKIFKYLKFFEGCFDLLIIPKYFFLILIETNILMLQNISCRDSLYYRTDSCIEFFEIKGFDDIIISSTSKSFQFIIELSFGGSHNDRRSRMVFSDMLT